MSRFTDGERQSLRLLGIWNLLQHGKTFTKKNLAQHFGVSEKSIQRDIALLNGFWQEQGQDECIRYSRYSGCYYWQRHDDLLLNEEEIIVLATVLLESRALPKRDLQITLDKLLTQSPEQEREKIKQLIGNEIYNYQELQNSRSLGRMILDLSEAKQGQLVTELDYKKIGADKGNLMLVEPLGIMFAEFYFYLICQPEGSEKVFSLRLDRIQSYTITRRHFEIKYDERFQEGIFRREVQLMHTGEFSRVKFKYWGRSLEAVLDKLPNAKVLYQDGSVSILEAKVYLAGAKMWFLSQGEFIEILEPAGFRQEMSDTLQRMLNNYK